MTRLLPLPLFLCLALASPLSSAAEIDAQAAETLARQNGCFKCHSIDKVKDAPSYKSIAVKYKGKADAEARLIKHITTSPKVKFDDGHEEEHKVIKTSDEDRQRNLVRWILAL